MRDVHILDELRSEPGWASCNQRFNWCRGLYGLRAARDRRTCGGKPANLDHQEFSRSHRLMGALAISIVLSYSPTRLSDFAHSVMIPVYPRQGPPHLTFTTIYTVPDNGLINRRCDIDKLPPLTHQIPGVTAHSQL